MKLYLPATLRMPGLETPAKLGESRLTTDPATARRLANFLGTPCDAIAEIEIDDHEPEALAPLAYDAHLVFDSGWTDPHERIDRLASLAHQIDPWAHDDALVQIPAHAWWVSLHIAGTCIAYGGDESWRIEILSPRKGDREDGDTPSLNRDGEPPRPGGGAAHAPSTNRQGAQ